MLIQLKNFIENDGLWRTKRVNFVDFKTFQEIEFIKDDGVYKIISTFSENDKLKKNKYEVSKKVFYEKFKTMIENTVYNPENYKLNKFNKYGTLLSLWFNM